MHDGQEITSVEGLARGSDLHPMQAAFIEHDGFQCGYCTSGQICSAIGMLNEVTSGMPSVVTPDLADGRVVLTDAEIRERMSGNICRCAAYPNILAAIKGGRGGHDMRSFSYARPDSNLGAVHAATVSGASFIAGGTNILDLMKLEVETPSKLVDVNRPRPERYRGHARRWPADRRHGAQQRPRR